MKTLLKKFLPALLLAMGVTLLPMMPVTVFAAGLTGPTTINAQVGVTVPYNSFYAGNAPWQPITISGTLPDGLVAIDIWSQQQQYQIQGTAQPGTVGTWPITASNADGGTINCDIIVSEGPQTIAVDYGGSTNVSSIAVPVGTASFNLNAYSLNGNGDKITGIDTPTYTYGGGNPAVATVDATGNVTIVGAGTTTFTIDSVATNSYTAATQKTITLMATTIPDAPTGVTATAGDGQATIAFTPPAITGGSAITGYTVTALVGGVPSGITASGAGSPITVTGLANGTAYTFTVTAANAVSTSAASAPSNAVTPMALGASATSVPTLDPKVLLMLVLLLVGVGGAMVAKTATRRAR